MDLVPKFIYETRMSLLYKCVTPDVYYTKFPRTPDILDCNTVLRVSRDHAIIAPSGTYIYNVTDHLDVLGDTFTRPLSSDCASVLYSSTADTDIPIVCKISDYLCILSGTCPDITVDVLKEYTTNTGIDTKALIQDDLYHPDLSYERYTISNRSS